MHDSKKPDDGPDATYSGERVDADESRYGASKRRTKPAQYAHWTGDHYPGDFGSPLAAARQGRGRRGQGPQGPGPHGAGMPGHGPRPGAGPALGAGPGAGPGRHRRGAPNSGGFGGLYSDQSHPDDGPHHPDEGDERY